MRMPAPPNAIPPRRKNAAYVAQGKRIAAMSPGNKPGVTVGPDGVARHGNGKIVNNDDNRERPVNWNSRHQLILWMDLAGQSVTEIARQVGMMHPSVSAIRSSPLYQTQKAQLTEKLMGSTLENLMEMIRRDAPQNLQVLINLRDKIDANGGDPKIVLGAAKQLSHETDRLYPRKTHHVEDRTIRLTIEAAQLNRLAGALREIGHNVPVELIEATDGIYSDPDAPPLSGKSVEELIAQTRAEAAARSSDEPS